MDRVGLASWIVIGFLAGAIGFELAPGAVAPRR
jgi:hypothetical protein